MSAACLGCIARHRLSTWAPRGSGALQRGSWRLRLRGAWGQVPERAAQLLHAAWHALLLGAACAPGAAGLRGENTSHTITRTLCMPSKRVVTER